MKSKLELTLEERFEIIDKDDVFFLVSKDVFDERDRSKIVIAVQDMAEQQIDEEIIITANIVKSLANQTVNTIDFMLGYYSEGELSRKDVLANNPKYEDAFFYVDLYQDGYYDEVEMINLSDEETILQINACDFWQNSNVLIFEILDALSSVLEYYNFAKDLMSGVSEDNVKVYAEDGLHFSGDLTLIQKSINNGWESLDFSSGTIIAELEGENGSVMLDISGEVKIIDVKDGGKEYHGNEIFENEEIREVIKSGKIDANERYIIDSNNWFEIIFFNSDGHSVDGDVMEAEPKTVHEIVKIMKSYYEEFQETDKDIKKEKDNYNYIVVALELFCFDGQITENDYCLDLMDSEHIDASDYDKRDFKGEFVLGIYEATSNDEAIRLASLNFGVEPDMLSAYKLA